MAITFKELPELIESEKRVFYVDGKYLHEILSVTYNTAVNEFMLHVDATSCGSISHGQVFAGGEKINSEDCVLVGQTNTEDDQWYIQG